MQKRPKITVKVHVRTHNIRKRLGLNLLEIKFFKKDCDLVLEGSFGQGSRSWNSSSENSIRSVGLPLRLERFWPSLIAYILCPLSYCSLWFGSCLRKKNTNNKQVKEEAN